MSSANIEYHQAESAASIHSSGSRDGAAGDNSAPHVTVSIGGGQPAVIGRPAYAGPGLSSARNGGAGSGEPSQDSSAIMMVPQSRPALPAPVMSAGPLGHAQVMPVPTYAQLLNLNGIFDDSSSLYNNLNVHKSGPNLKQVLDQVGQDLIIRVNEQIQLRHDRVSAQDMQRQLVRLQAGEQVLVPPPLQYTGLHFAASDSAQPKKLSDLNDKVGNIPGFLLLTNQRLLFASCQGALALSGTLRAPTGPKPSEYHLDVANRDWMFYYPVNISDVQHVSFQSDVSASASVQVHPNPACCDCMCRYCNPCCPKLWQPRGSPLYKGSRSRILEIAMYLPPWGEKTTVSISLDPAHDLRFILQFIATLESVGPRIGLPSSDVTPISLGPVGQQMR